MEKAIQYRDKIIKKDRLMHVEDRRVHNNKKTTNTSVVNGVSRRSGNFFMYIEVSSYKRKKQNSQ